MASMLESLVRKGKKIQDDIDALQKGLSTLESKGARDLVTCREIQSHADQIRNLQNKKGWYERKIQEYHDTVAQARDDITSQVHNVIAKLQAWKEQLESDAKSPKSTPAARYFAETAIKRIQGILNS
jgi:hypothetical protein